MTRPPHRPPNSVGWGSWDWTAGEEHLSQITTLWTMLLRAHTPADDAAAARHALLERYGGAVGRYLLGAVHDPDAAAELTQEFAVRFLRGDFRRAEAARGRFRDYLKTALIHLVDRLLPRQAGRAPATAVRRGRRFGDLPMTRTGFWRPGGRNCLTALGTRWQPPTRPSTPS